MKNNMQRTITPSSDSEKRRSKTAGEVIIENLQKDSREKEYAVLLQKNHKNHENYDYYDFKPTLWQ